MRADLDATLAALADPTRRAVVELLRERPRRASDLAAAAGATRPAMSRHLRVLRTAGLVEQEISERDARERIVRLKRSRFAELRDWLGEVEAFWNDQLEAFRAHAEGERGSAEGGGG
jgi:DNA-binding transcriptional ArsR family regulator